MGRFRRQHLAVAFAVAALGLVVPIPIAMAAEADGCSGEVSSFAADGTELDRASGPGPGATSDEPLLIDPEGTVVWSGETNAVITDAEWSVTIMGVPFLSGSTENSDGLTAAEGTTDLSTIPSPAKLLLKGDVKIPVSGSFTGSGGACTGSGYISGTGSPTSAPMFYAGIGFAAIGAAFIVWTIAGTGVRGGV